MARRSKRTFHRDSKGRFAAASSGSRRGRTAAAGAGLALGVLYAANGKGAFRLAGAALGAGSAAYGVVKVRRQRRRRAHGKR